MPELFREKRVLWARLVRKGILHVVGVELEG